MALINERENLSSNKATAILWNSGTKTPKFLMLMSPVIHFVKIKIIRSLQQDVCTQK